MRLTKREFLKRMGVLGVVGASGTAVLGDDYVADPTKLPPGSVGDPKNGTQRGQSPPRQA